MSELAAMDPLLLLCPSLLQLKTRYAALEQQIIITIIHVLVGLLTDVRGQQFQGELRMFTSGSHYRCSSVQAKHGLMYVL